MRKISLILFFTVILSYVKAQDALPVDLCSGIDQVMKYSFDEFKSIKSAEQKTKIGYFSEYFWASKYELQGFTENYIRLTITNKSYFNAQYFKSTDTEEGLKKYNELIELVKQCLPNLCCDYVQTIGNDFPDMKRYEFWSKKIKPTYDKKYDGVYIAVNFIIETKTKEAIVSLSISPKE